MTHLRSSQFTTTRLTTFVYNLQQTVYTHTASNSNWIYWKQDKTRRRIRMNVTTVKMQQKTGLRSSHFTQTYTNDISFLKTSLMIYIGMALVNSNDTTDRHRLRKSTGIRWWPDWPRPQRSLPGSPLIRPHQSVHTHGLHLMPILIIIQLPDPYVTGIQNNSCPNTVHHQRLRQQLYFSEEICNQTICKSICSNYYTALLTWNTIILTRSMTAINYVNWIIFQIWLRWYIKLLERKGNKVI